MRAEPDVRSRKRDWVREQILDAAWQLAQRDGVASLSLRELGANVGMRAPSLYHYFPSKAALYDAMYARGMRQFADAIEQSPPGRTAHQALRNRARVFVQTAAADPVRFELLFHRPVPGFAPSPQNLALGLTALASTREIAAAAGLRSERAFDLFLAITRGLVALQIANEPGGRRWLRLVDDAVDMLLAQQPSRSQRR